MLAKAKAEAQKASAMPRTEEEQAELDDKLSRAAWFGEAEEVVRLLDLGADVEKRQDDAFGFTPLIRAAKAGHAEVMRLLLAHGAAIGGRDNSGWGPSHWAASFGKTDALAVLVAHGGDLTKRTSEGWTPHDVAAMKGKKAVVDFLASLPATPSRATPAPVPASKSSSPQRSLAF